MAISADPSKPSHDPILPGQAEGLLRKQGWKIQMKANLLLALLFLASVAAAAPEEAQKHKCGGLAIMGKDSRIPISIHIKKVASKTPNAVPYQLWLNMVGVDESEILDVLSDWETDYGKDHKAVIIIDSEVPLSAAFHIQAIVQKSVYKKIRLFVKTTDKSRMTEIQFADHQTVFSENPLELAKTLEQE